MAAAALAFVGGSIASSLGYGAIGVAIGQALGGGIGSELSGGDFWQGAAGGAVGGLVGYGMEAMGVNSMLGDALGGELGGIASGALRGGIVGAASGGDFMSGALSGGLMQSAFGNPVQPSGSQSTQAGWGGATPTPASGNALASPGMAETSGWGFGTDQTGMTDAQAVNAPSWSAPAGASQQAMLDAQVSGMNVPTPTNSLSGSFDKLVDAFKSMAKGGGGGSDGKDLKGGGSDGKDLKGGGSDGKDLKALLISTGANLYLNKQNQAEAEKLMAQADPYGKYRAGDAAKYNALLANPNEIYTDPSYLAARRQGEQSLMRQAAATGKVDSGQLTQGLYDNGTALASQWYNQRLAQLGATSGAAQSPANAAMVYSAARNPGYLQNALYNPGLIYGR